MARSPKRIFEFWKQEKVTGSQIWRIRWLSNDFCFVFSQKFSHIQAGTAHYRGEKSIRYEPGGDALHTQNMTYNVLSRSIRDVKSLCYLSKANDDFRAQFSSLFDVIVVNLLTAGKFQYKSISYKMQNLYIKSLDISSRVPDLNAGWYIDQPRRQRKVQCKKFV